jgi:hypothetical protein
MNRSMVATAFTVLEPFEELTAAEPSRETELETPICKRAIDNECPKEFAAAVCPRRDKKPTPMLCSAPHVFTSSYARYD